MSSTLRTLLITWDQDQKPGAELVQLEHEWLQEGRRGREAWGCRRNDHLSPRGFKFSGAGGHEHTESHKQALPRASQGWAALWTDLWRRASKPNYSDCFFFFNS